jgi:uncharacterized protein involved in exopolysaccharide biosynthesis
MTVLGLIGSSLYAFLAPKWYEAQLVVVPSTPTKSPGGIAGMLASELPVDFNLAATGTSDAERIQAVLKSRSVTDAVIAEYRLQERYDEKNMEATRKALWKHCSTKLDKKPNTVSLTCEDKDPDFVRRMCHYFGEFGNSVFRRISASSAGEERRFLERRVAEARREVTATSDALRAFQEEHKLIDLGEQSKAVVSALASIKGDLLTKQIQLSYLNGFAASDEATANQVRRQIAVLEHKLKSLEVDESLESAKSDTDAHKPGEASSNSMFPVAMRVPQLRFKLEQLYRDQKIQETVFLLLTQRYEMAKVNEARDTSAFQILDEPVVPTYKSRPLRALIIGAGTLIGLLLGFCWMLYSERIRRAWHDFMQAGS